MPNRRYKQARADFEALQQICELDDQVDLDSRREHLMQNPCKAVAADMYESGIQLWFDENGVTEETREIAERHGIVDTPSGGKKAYKRKILIPKAK